MKKFLFCSIALIATVVSLPAIAADMPVKAIYKAPPAPVARWTGFYFGINGGYGWNQTTGDSFCFNPARVLNGVGCDVPNGGVVRPRGGFAGAQAGYNWQLNSRVVVGLETDIQWSNIQNSASVGDVVGAGNPPTGTFSMTSKLDWFGTFRGRLGLLATPDALLYVTGGLIYGREAVSTLLSFPIVGPAVFYPSSASSTRAGATVGAGLEYAFTPNFSAKVEGLWYDMGSMSSSFTCPAGATTCVPGFTSGANFKFGGEMVRGGLNWKFNGFSG
jgi:outer membrane immunogenic protein